MEETTAKQEVTQLKPASMTIQEVIFWLEAILDDTLDPHDDADAERIEAVELAVEILRETEMRAIQLASNSQNGRS